MNNYALLIGLNYTTTSNRLFGCINDCLLVQNMLINNFDFKPENITFMRDDIYSNIDALFPSRNNIIKCIKDLIDKTNKGLANQIYIHYSGHGSYIRDLTGDELDGNDEFIVPSDFFTSRQKILDDELFILLKGISNNSRCFMVFDCCNSGSIVDLPFSYNYENGNFIEKMENQDSVLLSKSNIISLSACRDNEYALDVSINGKPNGAMTMAIYSVLNQNSWIVSLKELITSIYQYLLINKYNSMRPLLSSNKKLNLNEINYNFKENKPVSPVVISNNNSSSKPEETTTQQTTNPEESTTQPQSTTQPEKINPNISTIQNVLEMCVNNKIVSKQELKDLIAKITA